MSRDHELCAFWKRNRFSKIVDILPIEAELRYAEQRLSPTIGINHFIFHVLAAKMHVRHVVQELNVSRYGLASDYFVIVYASRYLEQQVRLCRGEDHLLWRLLGED